MLLKTDCEIAYVNGGWLDDSCSLQLTQLICTPAALTLPQCTGLQLPIKQQGSACKQPSPSHHFSRNDYRHSLFIHITQAYPQHVYVAGPCKRNAYCSRGSPCEFIYSNSRHCNRPSNQPSAIQHGPAASSLDSTSKCVRTELSPLVAADHRAFELPGNDATNHTLQTCSPEHILVYLQIIFLPKHAGTQLPDGKCIAAPSSVADAISHLRMAFQEIGRGSYWDTQTHAGNPAAAHAISQ